MKLCRYTTQADYTQADHSQDRAQLAEREGWSDMHLQRVVEGHISLTPKAYAFA